MIPNLIYVTFVVVLRSIYREDPLKSHLPTPTKRPLKGTNFSTFNEFHKLVSHHVHQVPSLWYQL